MKRKYIIFYDVYGEEQLRVDITKVEFIHDGAFHVVLHEESGKKLALSEALCDEIGVQ